MMSIFRPTSFLTVAALLFILGRYEGASAKPHGGLLNGVTGVLPFSLQFSVLPTSKISAHKKSASKASKPADILKETKSKIDKGDVSQLDSSIQNDFMEDGFIPKECSDKYGIRDGVLKHAVRGVRDIVTELLLDVDALDKNELNSLLPHLIKGLTEAVTYILCGVDDAVSDIASGVDNGLDSLTQYLVELLQGKKSSSLSKLPDELSTVLQYIVGNGVGEGLHDLLSGVKTGVDELTSQIDAKALGTDVSGLLTEVEKGLGV